MPRGRLGLALWDDRDITADRLKRGLYARVEELLGKVAPPNTEVTLTLSDWQLYERVDMDLVARQGKRATKLQRSEYGGLKCWREPPPRAGISR